MAKIDVLEFSFLSIEKYSHKKLKDYHFCLFRTFGGILYCLKLSITELSVYVYLSYTICNFQKPEKNVRCVCKYIFFIWSADEMNICQG